MIEHVAMVFQAEGLNGAEKILLAAYCNHTDAHGYCWPGIPRLADETGTSERTVKRTNALLREKNLIKSVRRVNPRTGEPITNLTRVNLALLASIRRLDRDYDDNLVEAITFDEDEVPPASTGISGEPPQGPDLLMGQSDTDLGANLSPGRGQSDTDLGANVAPNPSSDPSVNPDPDARARAGAEPGPDGRTDGASLTDGPGGASVGLVEVSAEALARAGEIAARLDLVSVDARPKQVVQITRTLAEVLSRPGVDPVQVERYAATKVREARTVKYVLTAFDDEHLDLVELAAYPPAPPPAEPCPQHPGASRRSSGECAGCFVDRTAVDQVEVG